MDSFSIWHLMIFAPLAASFAGVAANRSSKMIGRGAFLLRLFVLTMFGVALSFFLRQRDEDIAAASMLLFFIAMWGLVPYWAVSRLRDMGIRRKYLAVITMIPLIGWAYTVYLVCAKGTRDLAERDAREVEEDDLPPVILDTGPTAIEAPKQQAPRQIAS